MILSGDELACYNLPAKSNTGAKPSRCFIVLSHRTNIIFSFSSEEVVQNV